MRIATRARYRSRQVFTALRPRVDPLRRADALSLLREPEQRLFSTMTLRDQQHCLDVYARLRLQGHDDTDLLAAALLHDVGKGRISVWHRVAYVLLAAAAPGLLRRLAAPGDGLGWRQALYRCRHHPQLGAKLAREAGASGDVVALIGEQQLAALDGRLRALQAADDVA